MPKYFTKSEAERVLPLIQAPLRRMLAAKASLDEAERALRAILERIGILGGSIVDPEKVAAAKRQAQQCAMQLREAIENVQAHGCLIKDLDLGLVDFPTLYHGREVYLCWKAGEPAIEFWHGTDEGFKGRKTIDQDFLDNHRSE